MEQIEMMISKRRKWEKIGKSPQDMHRKVRPNSKWRRKDRGQTKAVMNGKKEWSKINLKGANLWTLSSTF